MLRLLGTLTLLAIVFGLGYYVGQRPIGELKQTVKDLSRNVLDSAFGVERKLRLRQGLVEAKARVIEAKSKFLDRNFGLAAKELGEAIEHLGKAASADQDRERESSLKALSGKLEAVRQDLASGKEVARARVDEIQRELDALLPQGQ